MDKPDWRLETIAGEKLREFRQGQNVTVRQFAKEINISHATLHRIETGSVSDSSLWEAKVWPGISRFVDERGLSSVLASLLVPRVQHEHSMPELRQKFFADEWNAITEIRRQFEGILSTSFSVMDENGMLLLTQNEDDDARTREGYRISRLSTCRNLRQSLVAPDSTFRPVGDDGPEKHHPCNAHDAHLIRSAIALGKPAFSRCPSGFLSVIVPLRVSEILGLSHLYDASSANRVLRAALEKVDFCFGVPLAQTAYQQPTQGCEADAVRFLFREIGLESYLPYIDQGRIRRSLERVVEQTHLDSMQKRSTGNFVYLSNVKEFDEHARPRWGSLGSAVDEAWLDYQLDALLMADPLFGPSRFKSQSETIMRALLATGDDVGDGDGDALRKLDDDEVPHFSLEWLATQHQTTDRRQILANALADFRPGMEPRANVPVLATTIKTMKWVFSHWIKSAWPSWLRRHASQFGVEMLVAAVDARRSE